jgi:hypothetical protein
MTAANDAGFIFIDEGEFSSISVRATVSKNLPPVSFGANVSSANLSLWLTVEEARAVVAQLETVIEAVTNEVVA